MVESCRQQRLSIEQQLRALMQEQAEDDFSQWETCGEEAFAEGVTGWGRTAYAACEEAVRQTQKRLERAQEAGRLLEQKGKEQTRAEAQQEQAEAAEVAQLEAAAALALPDGEETELNLVEDLEGKMQRTPQKRLEQIVRLDQMQAAAILKDWMRREEAA